MEIQRAIEGSTRAKVRLWAGQTKGPVIDYGEGRGYKIVGPKLVVALPQERVNVFCTPPSPFTGADPRGGGGSWGSGPLPPFFGDPQTS